MKIISTTLVASAIVSLAACNGFSAAEDKAFDNTIAIGFNLTSGNSDKMALNGTVTSELKNSEKHDLRMELNLNYGESESGSGSDMEKDTDNGKALAAYKYKYDNSVYLYSDDSIFYDKMADIDYRMILGQGLGYFVIDNDTAKLGIDIGLAYIQEKMTSSDSDGHFAGRLAFRHDQTLSESSKLWLSAEYIPSFEDSSDYLANAEAGIEASINTSLSLRLVAQDRYNSSAEGDVDRNDFSLVSALVYKL